MNHTHYQTTHIHCVVISQLFAIELSWSDKRRFEIYRRYGEFFTLQVINSSVKEH